MQLPCRPTTPKMWRRFHSSATGVWFVAIVPTVLWWHDSVLWVALISCYANAVGHFSAWQASRAEDNGTSSNQAQPGASTERGAPPEVSYPQ